MKKLNIDRFVDDIDKDLDLPETIPFDDEPLEEYLLRVDKEEQTKTGSKQDRRNPLLQD